MTNKERIELILLLQKELENSCEDYCDWVPCVRSINYKNGNSPISCWNKAWSQIENNGIASVDFTLDGEVIEASNNLNAKDISNATDFISSWLLKQSSTGL